VVSVAVKARGSGSQGSWRLEVGSWMGVRGISAWFRGCQSLLLMRMPTVLIVAFLCGPFCVVCLALSWVVVRRTFALGVARPWVEGVLLGVEM
jgi:hypothetical protein